MLRSEAVQRINDAIGFRAAGNSLEDLIIRRLQEAQRDLEKGKTLPKFLLLEDQTLTLPANQHAVPLPAGFLRDVDSVGIRFASTIGASRPRPRFLKRVDVKDGINAMAFIAGHVDETLPDQPRAPRVYAIRKNTIDFILTVTQTYNFVWDYYKAADVLFIDVENAWLANASEWLIGEAGIRVARNLGNQQAMADFDALRTAGRAAVFGEELASELSSGPIAMGGNL
jgi:hypothetical protein